MFNDVGNKHIALYILRVLLFLRQIVKSSILFCDLEDDIWH